MKYQFKFGDDVPMQNVQNTLLMSIIATEGLLGQARVRLDGDFTGKPDKHAVTIDGGSEVGQSIARIFTMLIIVEFGEKSFEVDIADAPSATSQQQSGTGS